MTRPWKRALVTGASSGIGRAFASTIAAGGADLVVVARRAELLEQLAVELRDRQSVEVEVIAADLCDPDQRATVVARLADPERPVDLLVNNAGVGYAGAFVEGEPEQFRQIIELNVDAVVDLAHASALTMREQGRGWIINVSSLGGHAPGPRFAVYSATKAFVTSFSEALHEELRSSGIVVTAVCPGATESEFAERAGVEGGEQLPSFLVQSPAAVVDEALAAVVSGKAVRVTGMVNRVTGALSTVMPRVVNRKLAGFIAARVD